MEDSKMITIKDVLMDASSLHWSDSLFLPEDEEWALETKGVDNTRQQLNNCSVEQLFEAFLYYYDNDAFIEFF